MSESSAEWYLLVPVHLRNTSANQTVRATWNISWSSSETYSIARNCSGAFGSGVSYGFLDCSVSSSVSFYLVGYLYDATTGAFYFSPGFFPTFYNFSFSDDRTVCTPNCTTTRTIAPPAAALNGSSRFTFRFDLVHPNASHLWEVYSVAFARTFASVTTSYGNFTGVAPLRASARASLDMGTVGRGAWLEAVTVR